VLAGGALLAWRFDQSMGRFLNLARQMEPRQTVVLLYEGSDNVHFLHAPSYYQLQKGGLCPQSFLANPAIRHLPAQLAPPFPWGQVDWETTNPLVDPAGRVFRYVIAKTSRPGWEGLPAVVPPHHTLRARDDGWLLFERR